MHVEQLSLFQEYFEAIGVDMEITTIEFTAFKPMLMASTFEQLAFSGWGIGSPYWFGQYFYKEGNAYNYSNVDDPYMEEEFEKALSTVDRAEHNRILKELVIYLLDQSYDVVFPAPYAYSFWQPWLATYSGETTMGTHCDSRKVERSLGDATRRC